MRTNSAREIAYSLEGVWEEHEIPGHKKRLKSGEHMLHYLMDFEVSRHVAARLRDSLIGDVEPDYEYDDGGATRICLWEDGLRDVIIGIGSGDLDSGYIVPTNDKREGPEISEMLLE